MAVIPACDSAAKTKPLAGRLRPAHAYFPQPGRLTVLVPFADFGCLAMTDDRKGVVAGSPFNTNHRWR
jgi:hypothetical protein